MKITFKYVSSIMEQNTQKKVTYNFRLTNRVVTKSNEFQTDARISTFSKQRFISELIIYKTLFRSQSHTPLYMCELDLKSSVDTSG